MQLFEPQSWLANASGASAPLPVAGLIVGPTDVLNLIEARRRLAEQGFQFGDPVPTDIFVYAVGEGPSRYQTKFGGLPYWPKDSDWPVDTRGIPLPFVGQFYFRDSIDIVGKSAEADLLVIFGELPGNTRCDPTIRLFWQDINANLELVTKADIPCQNKFDAFHCTRWRTSSFPDAEIEEYDDEKFGEPDYIEPNLACELFATQIGRSPFTLSQFPPSSEKTYLCCCAPIHPVTNLKYPFLNHEQSLLSINNLKWHYDRQYNYVDQWLTIGDSTSLFIYNNSEGNLMHEFILG